ncbi:MAG TPA: acyl-CoA synthetase [Solirubrobacteraceae bacterium]|nr:acyl-CoA synthetase [Solirubrobacteraceae bacterium]
MASVSTSGGPNATALRWPRADGPDALAEIERTPLGARGLPATTYDAVARAAQLWPDQPATSCLRDAELWHEPSTRTYRALGRAVHRAAAALYAVGVRRRDAVAVVSPNCEEMTTALLAAQAVGIASPINPGLSLEHAAELLRVSGARVIVAAGPELDADVWARARQLARATGATALIALRPTLPAPKPLELEALGATRVAYLEALAAGFDGAPLPGEPPVGGDIAGYLHTGGTTGTPKLAAHTHANEIADAWMAAAIDMLEPGGVLFGGLPLFHANALITTLLAPMLKGHHVVWAGPLGYRDPEMFRVFWKVVERYGIASMSGVPTVYARLAQVPVDADISTLRMPIVGAAPLPPAVVDAFRATTGLELCEGYGLTEATCATARNWPGAIRRGSVGQRMPYQQVRAVRTDEQTGEWEFLAPRERGIIVIKGPVVFPGYAVRGPEGVTFDAGDKVRDGWLDTGDLGFVDEDGYITLTGRAKDLIIRGGHNIDPAIIEDALLEHPAVAAAAAVGHPDPHAGEVPVAFVTLAPGTQAAEDELLMWAATRVPERAAAPKAVTIIDEIPLTAVGKPFKPELRRRATEIAAREALGQGYDTRAVLEGGTVTVVVAGGSEADVSTALAAFAFPWRFV